MAAKDYVKTAAAELHNAVAYLERQIHDLTQHRDGHVKLRNDEIGRHQIELKVKQTQLRAKPHIDASIKERAVLELEVHHLQQDIADKQHEIQTMSAELSRSIEAKQRHVNDLLARAKELESKANEPELAD